MKNPRPTKFRWSSVLWGIVAPRRRDRIEPTLSGGMLIALALAIGMAAYNAANNILFITLSLLLACLILSGVLSWMNFRRMRWSLTVAAPLRAGRPAVAVVTVRNDKRVLPSYGLWFNFLAKRIELGAPLRPETTFTGRGLNVRAILARAAEGETRERAFLPARIDPDGEARLEWNFRPEKRGRLRVELENVGSLFPFGFLKKHLAIGTAQECVVWPAPVEFRRFRVSASRRLHGGERMARVGAGSDLLALRRYESGDSHRLIHWKASARTRKLLVRQFAAESDESFAIWVKTGAADWPQPEQFELLLSFAATLAEDLFRADQLESVALDAEPPIAVRRVGDVEAFLDQLAVAQPRGAASDRLRTPRTLAARGNVITFSPDGSRGIVAWVDGEKMAAT
jgi:uncharacterized protein (DUF58 family)